MFKYLILFWAGAIAVSAEQPTTWVPYSGKYVEIITNADSSGRTVSHRETSGEEIRSFDGSLLTTTVVDGQRVSARLWEGCGQLISLDYAKKAASFGPVSPRKHPYFPPDAPLGTMTIGAVEFTAYPVHMSSGTGTVWVDVNDDIVGKIEVHTDLPGGGHYDMMRQLTSLDLNASVSDSDLQIPPEFTVPKSHSSAGCPANASGL